MTITQLLKPAVSPAYKATLRADHQALNQAQFDVFDDLIKTCACGIACRAHIFHPQINGNDMFLATCPENERTRSVISTQYSIGRLHSLWLRNIGRVHHDTLPMDK